MGASPIGKKLAEIRDQNYFATKIKAEAIKEGMYYRSGFKSGDMITLPVDFEDKINELTAKGSYAASTEEINSTYRTMRRTQARKKSCCIRD